MSMVQLSGVLSEILRDYHKDDVAGQAIKDLLMGLYARTLVQWEDIKALMIEYCTRGSLSFSQYPALRQ